MNVSGLFRVVQAVLWGLIWWPIDCSEGSRYGGPLDPCNLMADMEAFENVTSFDSSHRVTGVLLLQPDRHGVEVLGEGSSTA